MIVRLLFVTLCFASTAVAQVQQTALSASPVGAEIVFVVTFETPTDLYEEQTQFSWFNRSPLLKIPRLLGENPWRAKAYFELEPLLPWERPTKPRQLTFVGRTKTAKTLTVSLEYPTKKKNWKKQEVLLPLADAPPIELQDWSAVLSTQPDQRRPQRPPAKIPSGKQSAMQRWARAQANWFLRLRNILGDLGGFLVFASEQTRRIYDLPQEGDSRVGRSFQPWMNDPAQRMYETTTGALAIQESLQPDRMLDPSKTKEKRSIAISSVSGITVKSHPFDQMRAGKEVRARSLARFTPSDNYYLSFDSIAKMLAFFDFVDQWGSSLLGMYDPMSTDYGARDQLHQQLCLPSSLLTRLFGPAIINQVALTGNDPYLREGSDVSLLFDVKEKDIFLPIVQSHFDASRTKYPGVTYEKAEVNGITVESLTEARRRVSCYRAWIDSVMVYSNSKVAIERIIETKSEKRSSLAAATDFQYLRASVYPLDREKEDGFLYLSDEFIRHLVSPALRIKEKRRIEAVTSLKLLTNAVMFYGFEHGPGNPTFDKLTSSGFLNAQDLYNPEGGTTTWDVETQRAVSGVYGDLQFLTPLIEIPIDTISEKERRDYETFRNRYQQYWRRYFDPIGIRIKVDRTVKFDVTILPLIEQSTYNDLKDVSGGEPVKVDLSEFPAKTLLRIVFHLNPESRQVQQMKMFASGMMGPGVPGQPQGAVDPLRQQNTLTDWVGEWVTFWIEDSESFKSILAREYDFEDPARRDGENAVLDVFDASMVLGIHVKNNLSVAAFLVAFRGMIETTAPNTVVYSNLEPYKGVTIVQVAPHPQGGWTQSQQRQGKSRREPSIYYATIADGLYFSTEASALRGLVDKKSGKDKRAQKKEKDLPKKIVPANALFFVNAGGAEMARGALHYFFEQRARRASVQNMGQIWLLGRSGMVKGALDDELAKHYLGYRPVCPSGGKYSYDVAQDMAINSVYGTMLEPNRREAAPIDSPVRQLIDSLQTVVSYLQFTEDGLQTTVEIARK